MVPVSKIDHRLTLTEIKSVDVWFWPLSLQPEHRELAGNVGIEGKGGSFVDRTFLGVTGLGTGKTAAIQRKCLVRHYREGCVVFRDRELGLTSLERSEGAGLVNVCVVGHEFERHVAICECRL